MEDKKRGSLKRMFSISVYMIIFLFCLYSIIQIRFFYNSEKPAFSDGKFSLLFLQSPNITRDDFVLLKLTLFALTGIISFILMLTSFFYYQNPDLEKHMMKTLDKEIKQIRKNNPMH